MHNIDMYIAIVLINRILTRNEEMDDRGTVNLILLESTNIKFCDLHLFVQ